ncbi:meprin A subunit beta-like [Oryzias latipes]
MNFQVVFEAQKGAGRSTGGFSVDDINLYETECPHLSLQIDDFQRVLNTSASGSRIYSSSQYSSEGYAYRFAVKLSETFFGLSVQLLSGDYDDQLEWPSLRKQITFEMLDQNPTIQQQMAKRWSFTTNEYQVYSGKSLWDNPRVAGNQVFVDQNNQPVYGGLLYGLGNFATLEEMKTREFLKGGSAIFTLNFQDLTPLVNGSSLPCAKVRPLSYTHQPTAENVPPCLRTPPTTVPTRPTTTPTSTQPNPATTDNSIFNFSPRMMPPVVFIFMLMLMLLVS